MADYVPPLREIRFVLEHVVDLAGLSQLEAFRHADPDAVFGVLEEGGRFMAEVLAPLNRAGDREGSRLNEAGNVTTPTGFKQAYNRYVDAGWGGVPFAPEFGGGGFPWLVTIVLQEMLTSANMAFSLCPLLTQGAIDMMSQHGSADQQAIYLEKMVTGEWAGTMNLTEAEAGSDVGALRTRAIPAADGTWRITGTKTFITYGEHDLTEQIVHLVLARVPDAPPGTRGISCFIVPKYLVNRDGSLGERNDVRCVSIEQKMGIHASPTCVMSYGDEGGAVGYLIGEPNQGMRYMFTMMNNARLSVGLQGLALAERACQDATDYAWQRRQGRAVGTTATLPSLIVEHPDVRRMLLTIKAYTEAMRCLLYLNAESIDLARHHGDGGVRRARNELVELLTPISKAWSTDLGVELTSIAVQVYGGAGYVEDAGVAQYLRDSRIAPIYEGTNGIQAVDLVMRKLPMRGGGVVKDQLAAMAGVEQDLVAAGDRLAGMAAGLAGAVAALQEASDWLLDRVGHEPADALAGAAPYLRMFGLVMGGWLMARSAVAADRLLEAGPGGAEDRLLEAGPGGAADRLLETASGGAADRRWLEDKVATARFYSEQLLPQAAGLLPAATAGAAGLYAVSLAAGRG